MGADGLSLLLGIDNLIAGNALDGTAAALRRSWPRAP